MHQPKPFRFAFQPLCIHSNSLRPILTCVLIGLFVMGLFANSSVLAATVRTDSLAYEPGSRVSILGSTFLANETVRLVVTYRDGTPLPDGNQSTWSVVASGTGSIETGGTSGYGGLDGGDYDGFSTAWTMFNGVLPGDTLLLTATGELSGYVATTAFACPASNFDQLQNGIPGSKSAQTDPAWSNGNINQNNSCYGEGSTVPFRFFVQSLTANSTHTFQISFQALNGGKHSYDYITQYDMTESGPIITVGGECSSVAQAAPVDCATPAAVIALRDPRLASNYNSAPGPELSGIINPAFPIDGPGSLFAYNATNVSISKFTIGGSTSNRTLTATVTFKTVHSGSAGFFWGGHLAEGVNPGWGVGMGAGSITGSSWHMDAGQVDGSGGLVNRSIQKGLICLPPSITLSSSAGPYCTNTTQTCSATAGAASYFWTVTGGTLLTGQGTNSITYKITALPGNIVTVALHASNGTGACGASTCGTDASAQFTAEDCCVVAITCPPTATVACNQSTSPSVTGTATFTASSECPLPITLSHTDTETAGSCPQAKVISRLWKATDANGQLRAQCTQTINVIDNVAPVLSNCPANVTVECSSIPAPATPQATDNCDPSPTITMTQTTTPGSCAQQYTLTRTWTATDHCGNASSCSQVITVRDTQPPSITCPQAITVQCASLAPAPNPSLVVTSDACDPAPVVTWVSDVSDHLTCPETITRTYRSTDACGNSVTCTQHIIIHDTTPPVVTCPADVAVQCAADVPAPNLALVSATDNCDPNPVKAWVSDQVSQTTCPKIITRIYKATDACGNIGSCTQTITVDDTTPPVITCPANTSVLCGASSDPANTGYATATDNCTPTGSIVITHADVPNGSGITRTWTATDLCGNQSTCTQTINIPPDTTPPVITSCPDPVTVNCIADVPAPSPALVVMTDNCDPNPVATFVNDVQSGSGCPYTITRTYRASDASGNWVVCTQIITIDDHTPPVLSGCPSNVTVNCNAIPAPANVTATDNCAGVTLIYNQTETPGACAQEKTITRTWTATDFCGNQAACSQVITVVDDTAPVITSSPGAVTVQCAANIPAPNTALVVAADNCDPAPVISFVGDVSDGLSCPEKITRTYKALDACGNASFATQIITVHDTTPPTITCPAPVSVQCLSQVPQPNPALCTASDNCDPTPTILFVSDVPNGSGCPMTITRTYKAVDDCGNQTFCTQTITINDQTPPQITCPGPVTVSCPGDVPQANPALCTATDNCDPNPAVVWVSDVPAGTCPKTITRTYKATDACGNQATCQQIITVHDQIPPQLVGCPSNVSLECGSVPPPAQVTATDNCSTVTVAMVETTTPGSCPGSYTLTRTWTATDACNNQASCQQVITVRDNTAPQMTCPQPITVNCLGDVPSPDPALVVVTDNCDPNPIVTFVSDVREGAGCPMYIVRTYRAVDACGNAATCTQIITVDDRELPQFVGCPQNITVDCAGLPPVANVTATDNCDGNVSVTFHEVTTPGSCVYNYTVTRTWTAVDVCGNQAQCQQIITVRDNAAPQMTCPAPLTFQCIDEIPQPNPALVVVADNCDPNPVVTFVNDVRGTQSCPTVITRTYRAVDVCGNEAFCTQTITLNDQTPPVFTTFPGDQNLFQCQPTQICLPVAATDNCLGSVVYTVTNGPGSVAGGQWCYTPTGSVSLDVTLRAADTCGNFADRTFHVAVQLNRAPVISNCPSNAQVHWGQTYTVDLNATDPDAGQNLTYSLCAGAPAGASINPATGMLTFVATARDICDPSLCVIVKDDCNAADTCSFNICVNNDPPVISCPDPQTICYGYSIETQVTATDPDNGPYKFFFLVSGPAGVQVNSTTGQVTWANPAAGSYQVCVMVTDSAAVCSPCSPSNADTCCFAVNVVSLDLVIEKVHNQIQGQYTDVSIDFRNQGSNWPIAGYDLLIQYDGSAMAFQKATEGEFFTDCAWEYFSYRFGVNGNCGGSACPTGVVRIVALAETTGGNMANHPDCYTNDGIANPGPGSTTATQLASMRFLVADDRTTECQYLPIRFVWYDCGDNGLSNVRGDTLYISHLVYDYEGEDESGEPMYSPITGLDNTMPSVTGAPSPECDVSAKTEVVRCANFYNGGIDIICADSIDAPADVNLNGIAYEIADAVMFTNYFIHGMSAFESHVEGSIAASDVNHDGLTLSVADLVLLIRVIVGDAMPYPKEIPITPVAAGYSVDDGVVAVAGEVDISGAALVVRGNVVPELLANGMDLAYAYDGDVTRIVVTSPLDATAMHSFRGAFVKGIYGDIVSLELATSQGNPVTVRNVPSRYLLEPNYPNPFNPVTTISFALPEAGDYRLTIYNIEGRLVEAFEGRADAPGVFRVDWNAGDRASGVYLYRLDAGQFSQTRKMLLLK